MTCKRFCGCIRIFMQMLDVLLREQFIALKKFFDENGAPDCANIEHKYM